VRSWIFFRYFSGVKFKVCGKYYIVFFEKYVIGELECFKISAIVYVTFKVYEILPNFRGSCDEQRPFFINIYWRDNDPGVYDFAEIFEKIDPVDMIILDFLQERDLGLEISYVRVWYFHGHAAERVSFNGLHKMFQ